MAAKRKKFAKKKHRALAYRPNTTRSARKSHVAPASSATEIQEALSIGKEDLKAALHAIGD